MHIRIAEDYVEIDGYVNAVERLSKPLMSRIGMFFERITKGAFGRALKRNDDVHILLNHEWDRDLGSTKTGELELTEDAIGLRARARITDKDVIEKARNNDLVGWSFGFYDREVEQGVEQGLPLRQVLDLDLEEVSLLDRTKTPAYDGTLVTVRADDKVQFTGEAFIDEVTTELITRDTETEDEETPTEPEKDAEENKEIDYSEYEEIISEMKGAYKE